MEEAETAALKAREPSSGDMVALLPARLHVRRRRPLLGAEAWAPATSTSGAPPLTREAVLLGRRCDQLLCPHRQYYWYDERGKKVKCTAPQYVDFVMSSVQKLVTDEDVFPTRYGRSRSSARGRPAWVSTPSALGSGA